MSMNKTNLRSYLDAQIRAYDLWIWEFGIDTGMNLREYFTENELWKIWISRHSQTFHDDHFKDYNNRS